MPMGGQGQHPVSQGGVGQRVFDFRLHQFLAMRAITAGDCVFGDRRFDIRRDVFDHAGPFGRIALARGDGSPAIRAGFQVRMLNSIRDLRVFRG